MMHTMLLRRAFTTPSHRHVPTHTVAAAATGAPTIALVAIVLAFATPADAQDSAGLRDAGGWFARAWGGLSRVADTQGSTDYVGLLPVIDTVDVSGRNGFNAGAGLAYRFREHLGVEVAWEHRSNDTRTRFGNGPTFPDGESTSSTFFLNGFYYFARSGPWQPYVGAGVSYLQEVDLDLEGAGAQQSYSGDGEVGGQLFVGANYRLRQAWSAQGEIRYTRVSDIDFPGENLPGTISGLDYEALTLQLGVTYAF